MLEGVNAITDNDEVIPPSVENIIVFISVPNLFAVSRRTVNEFNFRKEKSEEKCNERNMLYRRCSVRHMKRARLSECSKGMTL